MNHQYEKLRTSLILSNQGPIIVLLFSPVCQLASSDLNYVTLTIENVKILTDNIDDDIDIDAVVWSVIQFCQHFVAKFA